MKTSKNLNALVYALLASLVSFSLVAQEPPTQASQQAQQNVEFSEAELEQMLAPIALYPDSLLTHVLIGATYPLELIQAERWLADNPGLDGEQLASETQDKPWDPSVKALLPFPRVLKRLSDEIQWTQNLGDAFLQDEQRVLESIQSLRQKADQAGNLDKMENMQISREQQNIVIQPTVREVIYVPYYDTRVVYGNWHWSHHPPVHWRPSINLGYHDYQRGPFSWHLGINISLDHFFGAFHWHNRHVVVHHRNHRRQYSHGHRVNRQSSLRWQHNPSHRRGVAYRSAHIKQRFHSNRASRQSSAILRADARQFNANRSHLATNKVSGQDSSSQVLANRRWQLTRKLTRQSTPKVRPADNHFARRIDKATNKQSPVAGRPASQSRNKSQEIRVQTKKQLGQNAKVSNTKAIKNSPRAAKAASKVRNLHRRAQAGRSRVKREY